MRSGKVCTPTPAVKKVITKSSMDSVITFFTAGVGVQTLPLRIYSMIKIAVTPEVNAVSTLLMLLTLTMIVLAAKFAPDVLKGKG